MYVLNLLSLHIPRIWNKRKQGVYHVEFAYTMKLILLDRLLYDRLNIQDSYGQLVPPELMETWYRCLLVHWIYHTNISLVSSQVWYFICEYLEVREGAGGKF